MAEASLDGRFKLGAYYHSADDNYGFYAMVDQPLGDRLSIFGMFAWAPKRHNDNNYSIGLGGNYAIADRHAAGLAATHAGLHEATHHHETAVELYYRYTLSDRISLQPEAQYIVNPSAATPKPDNALVALLRVRFGF